MSSCGSYLYASVTRNWRLVLYIPAFVQHQTENVTVVVVSNIRHFMRLHHTLTYLLAKISSLDSRTRAWRAAANVELCPSCPTRLATSGPVRQYKMTYLIIPTVPPF